MTYEDLAEMIAEMSRVADREASCLKGELVKARLRAERHGPMEGPDSREFGNCIRLSHEAAIRLQDAAWKLRERIDEMNQGIVNEF